MALTMLSCGYNLKTDRELIVEKNQIAEAQNDLNEVKEEWKQFKDSLAMVVLKDSLRLVRFKDSVDFTNLSRTMCYNNKEHRHSCEIYGNPIIKAAKEAENEVTNEAIYEQSEVAMNEQPE